MAILQTIIPIVILGLVYYRMIKREIPTQISWLQALLPIAGGVASFFLSMYMLVALSLLIKVLGLSVANADTFIKSVFVALLTAGAPEELTKLIFIIIAILIFRKNIKNVYEYILIGAAVGIGFTIPEEFGYASDESINWIRLLTLFGHMVYGIIMAKYLGVARYNKINGKPRLLQYVLAIAIPILIHTLYDACTGGNLMLFSEESSLQDQGIILGLIATVVHTIGQFVILYLIKRNTKKYCDMSLSK